jgi:hypothetical protein
MTLFRKAKQFIHFGFRIKEDRIMADEISIELVKDEMKILNQANSGFKITRIINGQTIDIELTSQELSNAFSAQEYNFHIADISGVLESLEFDGKLNGYIAEAIIANKELMSSILEVYEENRDDYDMDWHEAALIAIEEELGLVKEHVINGDGDDINDILDF